MAKRSSFGPLVLVMAAFSCSFYVACGDDDVVFGTAGSGGSGGGGGTTAGTGADGGPAGSSGGGQGGAAGMSGAGGSAGENMTDGGTEPDGGGDSGVTSNG